MHATKFWLQMTIAKPKICTNVIQNYRIKPNDFCKNQQLANMGLNIKLKNNFLVDNKCELHKPTNYLTFVKSITCFDNL